MITVWVVLHQILLTLATVGTVRVSNSQPMRHIPSYKVSSAKVKKLHVMSVIDTITQQAQSTGSLVTPQWEDVALVSKKEIVLHATLDHTCTIMTLKIKSTIVELVLRLFQDVLSVKMDRFVKFVKIHPDCGWTDCVTIKMEL